MNTNELRAEMKRKNITFGKLAKALNISYMTLWNKTNGKTEFKLNEIKQIAKILELNDEQITHIFFEKEERT